MQRGASASVVGGFLALALEAAAGEVTLTPVRDNSMYQEYTENSNGAGYLFAGRAGGGGIRRALVRFDVAAALPAGATIDTVELRLTVSRSSADQPLPASLHRVLADWGEAGSNAGERSGSGAAAQPGDATWTDRFFPASDWLSPGGEFVAAASAAATIGGEGVWTFASNSELTADVQAWLDAPESNFGWILRGDESSPGTARRLDSREAALANRPTLTIEYSDPPAAVPIPRPVLGALAASLLYLVARAAVFEPR